MNTLAVAFFVFQGDSRNNNTATYTSNWKKIIASDERVDEEETKTSKRETSRLATSTCGVSEMGEGSVPSTKTDSFPYKASLFGGGKQCGRKS